MDRTDEILKFIMQKKKVSVEDLCKYLHCSPATTRRELAKLDKLGVIHRTRGGAAYRIGTGYDYSAQYRMSVNINEKQYICSLARDFISPGMSVFLDSSSTAELLCGYLTEIPNLTVITNGINASAILNYSDSAEIYIVGGHIERGSNTVLGESANNYIDSFNADIAFLSCQGLDKNGTSAANQSQVSIKQHMIKNAAQTIMLCDSSKFEKSFLHKLCSFDKLSAVITDKYPSEDIVQAICDTGCELLY